MYNKIFIKNNLSYILLLNLLLLSFFILLSFRPIPDSTHYLVSIVDFQSFKNLDKINEIISYVKTPIYEIIGPIFTSPFLYTCVSLIINFFLLNLIYIFFRNYFKDNGLAFFLTSLIIFFKFLILCSYFFKIEILQSLNYFLMNIDLFNNFTVRQVFGIIYLFALYFLIQKKYLLVCLLIFLNNFTHPNSNIFLIGIFGIYFVYLYLVDNKNLKPLLFFSVSNLLYLIFIFQKISTFNTEIIFDQNLYYTNLIRDEADDFSFLWTITYKLKFILLIGSISLLNLMFFLRKNKFNLIAYLSICPIIIFIIGSLFEYINLFTNVFIIDSLIINLQPAWKILGYAFFPFMIIFGHNLKYIVFNKDIIFKNISFLIVISTFLVFITFGTVRNFYELKNYYYYSFSTLKENNYEDWLKIHSYKNSYNFMPNISNDQINLENYDFEEKNIFILKKKFSKLPHNHLLEEIISFNDNYNFIKELKNIIPKDMGLIIPPYFLNARGIFKDYAVYYVEHPDGNFAMGNFNFFKEIHNRMIKLFDNGYSKMPNKQTKLNYSFLRQKYLQLKESQIISINRYNNLYKYFITEKNHILKFPIVFQNENFLIYEIK